jgi:hypothetical protein
MRSIALLSLVIILPGIAHADLNSFTPGPVIEDYGPVADVDITVPRPKRHCAQTPFRCRQTRR